MEAQLSAEFGEVISPIPKNEGWGRTTFVVPALGFAVGIFAVGFALRRMVLTRDAEAAAAAQAAEAPVVPVSLDDEELAAEVDREIALRI